MKKYKNPPLKEALCEFNFEIADWDSTFPGAFYKKIEKEFPLKENKSSNNISFLIENGGINIGKEVGNKLICHNAERSVLAQLSDNSLSINILPPYIGWEIFKPLIVKCIDSLKSLSPSLKLKNASLRYINVIETEKEYEKLEEVFDLFPKIPALKDDMEINSINMGIELKLKEEGNILIANQASLQPMGNIQKPILLDLRVLSLSVKLEKVQNWLEYAHTQIEFFFEKSVREEIKKNKFLEL
jgi:uncharacterized protein (TIGR04255 family)